MQARFGDEPKATVRHTGKSIGFTAMTASATICRSFTKMSRWKTDRHGNIRIHHQVVVVKHNDGAIEDPADPTPGAKLKRVMRS
jgi:hypothetical protein